MEQTKSYSLFHQLLTSLVKSIIGQFVGVIAVSDSQFSAEYKKLGYKKVTRYNVQITKKKYLEAVNTSAGAQETAVEFKPKRDSYYEIEAFEFLEHLKSNPDKKYIRLVWDSDKHNTVESVYMDGHGNIIGEKIEDVKQYVTPSALKSATEGYGRTKHMRNMDIYVNENDISFDNIAEIKVCGIHMVAPDLAKYIKVVR